MGSAAPVIAAGARRVRPDRMQEIQQSRAYEDNIITDITNRLRESNSEITANVVGDLLRADLYSMPEPDAAKTEEDIDAETLAEVPVVDEEQLEQVIAALRDVAPESIQEEIEAVMGAGQGLPARFDPVTGELDEDGSVFVLDEDGGIIYTDELIDDENVAPKLREILERNPRLLTMEQALWESYSPEFADFVKERFKKGKDGKLATSLTGEQQDFVDAKIQEFWKVQQKIAKRLKIKNPTFGPQPLKDLAQRCGCCRWNKPWSHKN